MSLDEQYADLLQRVEAFIEANRAHEGIPWMTPSVLFIGIKPGVELADATLQLVGDPRPLARQLVHALYHPSGARLLAAMHDVMQEKQREREQSENKAAE